MVSHRQTRLNAAWMRFKSAWKSDQAARVWSRVDVGGGKFRLPLIKSNRPGKVADISVTVEEGRKYHLNMINFVGVKLFRTPETLMRPVFQMGQGDVFSTAKLRKGFEELRKLYAVGHATVRSELMHQESRAPLPVGLSAAPSPPNLRPATGAKKRRRGPRPSLLSNSSSSRPTTSWDIR